MMEKPNNSHFGDYDLNSYFRYHFYNYFFYHTNNYFWSYNDSYFYYNWNDNCYSAARSLLELL
jgi:hypothetical protein